MPWALPTFDLALLPTRAGNHGGGKRDNRGGQDSGAAGAIRPAPLAPDGPSMPRRAPARMRSPPSAPAGGGIAVAPDRPARRLREATRTAAAAAGSPRGPGGIRTALPPGELPKLPDPGSGHHGDRPSGRLHQPHRQRTDQPVTRMGGRPDHDGVGVDLLSHPAQLSEGITPDGDEGDGDAELPGKLLRPAAHVRSDLLICLPAGGLQAPADTGAT